MFLVGPGRWWYTRHYRDRTKSSVFFVTGSASGVAQTKVDLRDRALLWLPLRGDQPGGVMLSWQENPPTVYADEVSESVVKPMGTFSGERMGVIPGSNMWSAARLRDRRIALLSMEEPPGEAWRLMLRLPDGSGGLSETALPCSDQFSHILATAVDADGRLAVVALSPRLEVVAMLVDLDKPQSSPCRVLSTASESSADAGGGSPSIVSLTHGFIVAWIRSDGRVRACQIASLAASPPVIDVGEGADIANPLSQPVNVNEDETLTFAWRTDRGIALRRLPQALTAYALFTELRRTYCDFVRHLREQ